MYKIGDQWNKTWIVTSEIQKLFIQISKDYNPIHTKSSFAKELGFKDKILHGIILNCFISFFVGEMLPTKNIIIIEQKIKYYNPFYIDDILNFNIKISKIIKSTQCIYLNYSFKRLDKVIAKGYLITKEL